MLRGKQVAPYSSATVKTLRPAVDKSGFYSKFSGDRAQCLGWIRAVQNV